MPGQRERVGGEEWARAALQERKEQVKERGEESDHVAELGRWMEGFSGLWLAESREGMDAQSSWVLAVWRRVEVAALRR